jgi:hypothetical protein
LDTNQLKFQAGLIYLLAMALLRRGEGHAAVVEAVQWLTDHGYSREARRLTRKMDHSTPTQPEVMDG